MKMYQAFADVALFLNSSNVSAFGLDFQTQRLDSLIKRAPSGTDFDMGTQFLVDRSNPECLVFKTYFHHRNENSNHDGWTEHEVIVKANLITDFSIQVTGKNKNNIREYIADIFRSFLTTDEIPSKEQTS